MSGPFAGLVVPMLTAFDGSLAPVAGLCIDHCTRLLDQGADGVALFGTTSEANSMSFQERKELLTAVRHSGVAGNRLMVGIGSCAFPETVKMLDHAAEMDAAAALLLPPFFYKAPAVTDDGLFDFVARLMESTADAETKVYLYHIPQVAVIGWSFELIRRLAEAFPERIIGLKDSAGDWEHTKRLIEGFPTLDIFSGFELHLTQGLRAGGVGCITATGNLNVKGVKAICAAIETDEAECLQEQATKVRRAVQDAGVPIAVMKAYLALKTGDHRWATVRPPLRPASIEVARQLDAVLESIGYQCGFA